MENVTGYDSSLLYAASGTESSDINYNAIVGSSSEMNCLPTWSTPRSEFSATLVASHYVYIIGGLYTSSPKVNLVDTTHLHDVQVFDVIKSQWLPVLLIDRFSCPRALHSAVLTDQDQVYVVELYYLYFRLLFMVDIIMRNHLYLICVS